MHPNFQVIIILPLFSRPKMVYTIFLFNDVATFQHQSY